MRNGVDKPVGVTGHTATVVGEDMIVLFGYSPDRGITNLIQVFGLGKCCSRFQVWGLTLFVSGNFSFWKEYFYYIWAWGWKPRYQAIAIFLIKLKGNLLDPTVNVPCWCDSFQIMSSTCFWLVKIIINLKWLL